MTLGFRCTASLTSVHQAAPVTMTSLLERYPVINICQTAVAAATTLPWKILEAVALIPFSWVLGWGPGNFRVTARPASAAATTRAGSTCRGSGGESSHFLDGHIRFMGRRASTGFVTCPASWPCSYLQVYMRLHLRKQL